MVIISAMNDPYFLNLDKAREHLEQLGTTIILSPNLEKMKFRHDVEGTKLEDLNSLPPELKNALETETGDRFAYSLISEDLGALMVFRQPYNQTARILVMDSDQNRRDLRDFHQVKDVYFFNYKTRQPVRLKDVLQKIFEGEIPDVFVSKRKNTNDASMRVLDMKGNEAYAIIMVILDRIEALLVLAHELGHAWSYQETNNIYTPISEEAAQHTAVLQFKESFLNFRRLNDMVNLSRNDHYTKIAALLNSEGSYRLQSLELWREVDAWSAGLYILEHLLSSIGITLEDLGIVQEDIAYVMLDALKTRIPGSFNYIDEL